MATSELIEALQALAHERKIDEFYLIERLEQSLAKSYERILDLEWDARVTIDRQTGKIYVYELVPVGEPDEETGEYSEFEERDVTPADVSRIADLARKLDDPLFAAKAAVYTRRDNGLRSVSHVVAGELASRQAVYAYNFYGRRYDIGDKEGFLEATVEQALKRPELRDRFMAYLMHTVGPLLAEEKTGKK